MHLFIMRPQDIDIWVKPQPENIKKLWIALEEFGAPLIDITPDDFLKPDIIYQIGIEPNRIDILTSIPGLEFDAAWKNKALSSYAGEEIYILSLDDLIRSKETTDRPQDRVDLEILSEIKRK
ncbi:MAG: hypothetical protein KAW87_03160 [Candidatus Cloacimonetes bacterium]|nr:hypothetical protein [Candidatus Cloacimonadota bacterium]